MLWKCVSIPISAFEGVCLLIQAPVCVNMLWRVVLTLKITPQISTVKLENVHSLSLSPALVYVSLTVWSMQNYWAALAARWGGGLVPKQLGHCWETNLILFTNFPSLLLTHPASLYFPSLDQAQALFHSVTCHLVISHLFPFFLSVYAANISPRTRHLTVFQPPQSLLPICVSDLTTRLK